MGFSDKVTKIAMDEMDLKNKSDNHIPIPIKLDNVSHAMTIKKSVKKSAAHSEFLFCLIIKICCFIAFIFLFLSSASQSQKIQKTISRGLFSNPFSYTIGQNSLFVLLKFFQKVLWCQNIWY